MRTSTVETGSGQATIIHHGHGLVASPSRTGDVLDYFEGKERRIQNSYHEFISQYSSRLSLAQSKKLYGELDYLFDKENWDDGEITYPSMEQLKVLNEFLSLNPKIRVPSLSIRGNGNLSCIWSYNKTHRLAFDFIDSKKFRWTYIDLEDESNSISSWAYAEALLALKKKLEVNKVKGALYKHA